MLRRFDRSSLPATPWKNGGGVTREVVCQPPGAGMDTFDWRVSIAHIASDGPFSAFAGVDRVITLLEGAGVDLCHGDGSLLHRLDTPLMPFAFAGEAAVTGRLLTGAVPGAGCHDLNVMTRRAACRAEVTVLRQTANLAPATAGVLLSVTGQWRVALHGDASTNEHVLAPDQGLWWQGHMANQWHCVETDNNPAAALWAVAIHSVSDANP